MKMWSTISSLFFLSLLCWWFRTDMTWVILSQKRCWADLKQKEKHKPLFQVHLWFSWMKAQSCQLMIWSSVPQCIVLSYISRFWVMEGLKIFFTHTLLFPRRFHDFKENIGNVTSVYPQDWGTWRQWIKNWLRLWSEKVMIYSLYKKIKKKWGFSIASSNFEQYKRSSQIWDLKRNCKLPICDSMDWAKCVGVEFVEASWKSALRMWRQKTSFYVFLSALWSWSHLCKSREIWLSRVNWWFLPILWTKPKNVKRHPLVPASDSECQ